MERGIRRRTTRRILVLLEVAALLLVLLGGGAVWFVATRGSDTGPPNVAEIGATASVNLAWDRSPSPRVAGYRILSGTEPGNYTESVSVGNAATATLTNLKRGTRYYIVVVAVDAHGKQSPSSNEIEVLTPN